jgi:hypothetical protein
VNNLLLPVNLVCRNYYVSLFLVDRSTKTEVFGGISGVAFEDKLSSKIARIEVRAGQYLDALNISLQNGTTINHGGRGGISFTVDLGNDEYICKVEFGYSKYIDQITFFSTKNRIFGPFGRTTGSLKSIDFGKGVLVGFIGRCGSYIDAIGFVFDTLP